MKIFISFEYTTKGLCILKKPIMRNFYLLLFFLCPLGTINAQPLKVGDKVPEIEFVHLLNTEETSTSTSRLKGKAILLDFWATWCAPCIANFPKLDQLQQKHKTELQIIAVSKEKIPRLERFLKNRPMSIMVASDTSETLQAFFPHIWIPHAVLIDADGIVRAITDGGNITESVVASVLKKQTPAIPIKADDLSFDPEKYFTPSEDTKDDFKITGYAKGGGSQRMNGEGKFEGRRWTFINVSFLNLFQEAFGFNSLRTKTKNIHKSEFEFVPENLYSIDIIVENPGIENLREELKKQLDIHFSYKARVEKRTDSVYLLKKSDDALATHLKPSASSKNSWWGSRGKFNGSGVKLAKIAEYLEMLHVTKKPIIDETGDSRFYDIEVTWEHENKTGVKNFLASLGLSLEMGIREYEVLVIYQ